MTSLVSGTTDTLSLNEGTEGSSSTKTIKPFLKMSERGRAKSEILRDNKRERSKIICISLKTNS